MREQQNHDWSLANASYKHRCAISMTGTKRVLNAPTTATLSQIRKVVSAVVTPVTITLFATDISEINLLR